MPDLDPRYASIVQYTYVCMYVCMCFCRYYTWHWCPIREENSHRRHKQRMELMFVAAMLAETHVYLRSFSPLPDFHPTPNRAYQMSTNLDRSLIYRLSLSLSLSADYANDRVVSKYHGGNTLPPFHDSFSYEFVYFFDIVLFPPPPPLSHRGMIEFWNRRKAMNQTFIDSDLWVFSGKFNGRFGPGSNYTHGMSVNPQWSPIYRVSLMRSCVLSFADVSIHQHGKSDVKARVDVQRCFYSRKFNSKANQSRSIPIADEIVVILQFWFTYASPVLRSNMM